MMPHIGTTARLVPHLLPGPASTRHQFTNHIPTKHKQRPPNPEQQLLTHGTFGSSLLTSSSHPHVAPASLQLPFQHRSCGWGRLGQTGCSEERCCIAKDTQLGG